MLATDSLVRASWQVLHGPLVRGTAPLAERSVCQFSSESCVCDCVRCCRHGNRWLVRWLAFGPGSPHDDMRRYTLNVCFWVSMILYRSCPDRHFCSPSHRQQHHNTTAFISFTVFSADFLLSTISIQLQDFDYTFSYQRLQPSLSTPDISCLLLSSLSSPISFKPNTVSYLVSQIIIMGRGGYN